MYLKAGIDDVRTGNHENEQGCMKVHFHHGRTLGRATVHCHDESTANIIVQCVYTTASI